MNKRLLILLSIVAGISSLGYLSFQLVSGTMKEIEASNRRTAEIIAISKIQRDKTDKKIAELEPKFKDLPGLPSNEPSDCASLVQKDGSYPSELDNTDSSCGATSSPSSYTDSPDRYSRRRRAAANSRQYIKKSDSGGNQRYSSRSSSRGRFRFRFR